MTALLIGCARVSTDAQDLTAQRDGLLARGVDPGRVQVDHGLTGTDRERPGLREALAACREGDTLVVTELDRLARPSPHARAIAEELTRRQVRLSLGGSVYDPHDPVDRLLFDVLARVAEFEADLIRLRTGGGCASRRPRGSRAASSPSSTPARSHPSWTSSGEVSTAPRNWPTCPASLAPPSIAPWSATEPAAGRTVTGQRPSARARADVLSLHREPGCPACSTPAGQPGRARRPAPGVPPQVLPVRRPHLAREGVRWPRLTVGLGVVG
ncbi:recombinase family protein [Geodermatophilus sp. URMC 63]